MIARWGYEALMVNQFMKNKYEKEFYQIDKKISRSNYMIAYYIPELVKINIESKELLKTGNESQKALNKNRNILISELSKFPNECAQHNFTPNTTKFNSVKEFKKAADVIENN